MKTLRALTLTLAAAACLTVAQAQSVRPEVGKPLQQAADYLKAGKGREALAKVREADAVGGKTSAEQLTIDRMKAAAAQRAGDNGTAAQALESLFPRVGGGEQAQVAESLAFAYSQQRDWPKSQQWANKAQQLGSNSAQLKQLVAYLQSQSGDYGAIAKDSAAAVAAAEKGGRKPDEGDLLRLADAQQRTGQMGGYINTLEKLLAHYPKKDYWSAYLGRLTRKSGFSGRLGLDVLRLRLASGTLDKTDDFMEMAQLSLQAGFPAEGLQIVEKGFASGALGTGAEGDRHKRLRDLAVKRNDERKASLAADTATAQAAKDGNSLVELGYVHVTMGQAEQGVKLIEAGIAKGGLKHTEDARLRLGLAQLQVPALAGKGLQTLRSLKGTDGVAEVGRLYALLGRG